MCTLHICTWATSESNVLSSGCEGGLTVPRVGFSLLEPAISRPPSVVSSTSAICGPASSQTLHAAHHFERHILPVKANRWPTSISIRSPKGRSCAMSLELSTPMTSSSCICGELLYCSELKLCRTKIPLMSKWQAFRHMSSCPFHTPNNFIHTCNFF